MKNRRFSVYILALLFIFYSRLLYSAQPDLSVKELVEKNIQSAGEKEKIANIKNFSFLAGSQTYYFSFSGQMKIMEGKMPVVTQVILTDSEKVKRNCYNNISEFEGLQKATYQALAQLRSGLFTLLHFKDQLEYRGLKAFGPKKHYMLTTNIAELEIDFYIEPEEYTIKRIVFKGFDEEGGKYEVNHDFGPFQEVESLKIPSSWFSSQVGARGTLNQISDVKINQALDKDFFSRLEVNVGNIEISSDALGGNIIDFSFQRGMLVIGTNWTDQCIKKAGFKAEDKLVLQISDQEIDIDFYESRPPRGVLQPGVKIMMPNRRDENYLILLSAEEREQLAEILETLLPIRVKRK